MITIRYLDLDQITGTVQNFQSIFVITACNRERNDNRFRFSFQMDITGVRAFPVHQICWRYIQY
jgi:hypothetical protein